MLNAIFLVLAIFLFGAMIPYMLANSIVGPFFRLFVVPGVILHELAHAAACLLTGAKIHRIRVFKRTGGEVAHEKAKVPIVGPLLITLAPTLIGLTAIILLSTLVINTSTVVIGTSIHDFVKFAISVVQSLSFHRITSIIWIYLILAISATMTPSWQDIKNSIIPIILIVVLIAIVFKTHILYDQFNQFASIITPALTFALLIILLLWCVALVVYLFSGIFGINR